MWYEDSLVKKDWREVQIWSLDQKFEFVVFEKLNRKSFTVKVGETIKSETFK